MSRAGHRAIDLARLAGISTQQVRNYADAGILPPVPRTESGYRRFGEAHRQAILTYRALAEGCGPSAARAIMHAVHAGDLPYALALVDAAHASLHERRLSLRQTAGALDAVADRPAGIPRTGMRIGEVAAYVGVRTSALRTWEAAGLLRPPREPSTGYRRFGPADVREALLVCTLRQGHHPLPQIRAVLDDLRRTGSREALHAAIEGQHAKLTRQATAMLTAAARLHRYVTP